MTLKIQKFDNIQMCDTIMSGYMYKNNYYSVCNINYILLFIMFNYQNVFLDGDTELIWDII